MTRKMTTDAVLYDAFGMTVSRTGTTATPFGFVGAQGYQSDADSGLQLLGHRYYDASIGRFLSSDPAKAGTNWYAYCENDPLLSFDEDGLDAHSGQGVDHHGAVYNYGDKPVKFAWDGDNGQLYWSMLPPGNQTDPARHDIDWVLDGHWAHTFPSGGDAQIGGGITWVGIDTDIAGGRDGEGFPREAGSGPHRHWHYVDPSHLHDIGWIHPINSSPRLPKPVRPIARFIHFIGQLGWDMRGYPGP
jgi:RHS repeat-associated protein